MSARYALTLVAAAALVAGPALALPGDQTHPIDVHFRRGTDSIRLTGELKQNVDCCYYRIKAHAGQVLQWRFTGPAYRAVITYPDGSAEGPGIPNAIPLDKNGAYILRFAPNLMADGAFGRFALTITILPPK